MPNRYTKILLVLILLLAAVSRFYKLGVLPLGLYSDEVAIGYNAYSILKTGKDEFGVSFPISFQSFNDYKPPLAIYLVALSESVFGVSDLAVRLPSAVFGFLTVPLLYIFMKQLGRNDISSLIVAGILAINPWHVMFSRSMMEVNIALTLTLIGIILFLAGLKKPALLCMSAVVFSLSLYAYHSSRLFCPLLLLFLFFYYRKELSSRKKWLFASVFIGFALTLPILQSLNNGLLVRAKGISILENLPDPDPYVKEIGYLSQDDNQWWARILHNRRIVSVYLVFNNYLKHFSPQFLFSDHGNNMFRVNRFGLFYIWELLTIPTGIWILFQRKRENFWLMLMLLLLAPLASSFSFSTPSAVRAMFMSFPLAVFSGVGLAELKNKIIRWCLFFIVPASFCIFAHGYFVHYPMESKYFWGYEYWEMLSYLDTVNTKYKSVVFIPGISSNFNEPYIFLLYHLKYSPKDYIDQGGTKLCRYGQNGRFKFGIYEFRTVGCSEFEKEFEYDPLADLPQNSLLVVNTQFANQLEGRTVYAILDQKKTSSLLFYETNNLVRKQDRI